MSQLTGKKMSWMERPFKWIDRFESESTRRIIQSVISGLIGALILGTITLIWASRDWITKGSKSVWNVLKFPVPVQVWVILLAVVTLYWILFVIVRAFRTKLKIKAEMIARNGEKKEILLVVNVVNVGLRPIFVNHVRVILNPQELSIIGNPAIKMKADTSELTAFQKNPIVEIKPHGGSHTWQMPFPTKPDFQVTEQNGEPYGNGYVELTSEDKKKFTFTILPDETWNIAPVFGGQVGHRCSRCDFMFLMKADAMSVICPKCKNEDVLKPKQQAQSSFPAPADLSRMAGKGNRFMGFGPEEIILSKLTFHVLRAYNRVYPKGALGIRGLAGYCQISEVDALTSVQELWNMKYIRTVIDMPGEWNSEYAITDIGRDYVRRHAK
jgi:hypothetical protein